MKTFLKKIILVLLVSFILIAIGSHLCYSYIQRNHINYLRYESQLIETQVEHLKKGNNFNTLFLGTSKTFRQIDPQLFDSINGNTKSINMGVNNLYPFRAFDFETFIADRCDSVKLIFYELRTPGLIGSNYNSIKTLISISGERNLQFLDFLLNSDYTFKMKVKVGLNYTKMFFYKSLGIGMKRLFDAKKPEAYFPYGGPNERGYYPLEVQQKDELEHNNKNGAQKDYNDFKKWLTKNNIRSNYKLDRSKLSKQKFVKSNFSEITAKHVQECFPNAEVIFVIPPHTLTSFYPTLLIEAKNLEKIGYTVLDFTYQDKYPLLYEDSTSFDIAHLNNKGAAIYTEALCLELSKRNIIY